MAYYFNDSARNYDATRRRRARMGYQEFGPYLGGPIDEIAGAETAAFASEHSSAARAIGIGVATGVLTFVVTRVLEGFFPRRSR